MPEAAQPRPPLERIPAPARRSLIFVGRIPGPYLLAFA
ncbi:hypothetical protein HX92_1193 [Mycobacterium tuberculosis]|nr:Uncharacterized protein BCGR_1045 [Mycobacterium tuberculosis variant bovis BCG]AOZ42045.1 hypothetical protein BTB1458_1039 [Mycobacterium tuberculosis]EQM21857.1 hypothetical protein GuangZ0019_1517 [Mycobacterium tuberculosis GuangZ0019]EQM22102.1 hypothetical protein FJ05194_1530 [Mycobacterium tuberculosis FJ05194]KAF3414646.1 hypothetical protein BIT18_2104 [Mycobacterium tuberculosis variant bovis]BAL64849.1 hypothetical protein ERDMAN_1043 [Mycobacterium tuberculosis str. Erdman = A